MPALEAFVARLTTADLLALLLGAVLLFLGRRLYWLALGGAGFFVGLQLAERLLDLRCRFNVPDTSLLIQCAGHFSSDTSLQEAGETPALPAVPLVVPLAVLPLAVPGTSLCRLAVPLVVPGTSLCRSRYRAPLSVLPLSVLPLAVPGTSLGPDVPDSRCRALLSGRHFSRAAARGAGHFSRH